MADAPNSSAQQRAVTATLFANAAMVAVLVDLERRAAEAASGYLRRLLNNELRTLATQYVLQFGGLDRPADPYRAQTLIDEFVLGIEDLRGYDPAPALQPFVDEAADRGVVWATRGAPGPVLPDGFQDSHEVQRILDEIPANVSTAIDDAQRLARSTRINTWSDAVRLTGKATQAVASVDRSAATVVSTALNDAVSQVATQSGARILWVAEPNACVVCLKLSGHLADPATGRWFDETATFGKPGSAPDVWPPGEPLRSPPRHPHCRCVTQPWWGAAPGTPGVVDLPAALQREAKRSVLLGRALPTESNNVRIDAADRLLRLGSGLPKTVEVRSRHAVKTGRFSNRIK